MAYISSLAAHAGLKTAQTRVDDDSVDLYIVGSGFEGTLRNPQIHLQLKCTSSPNIADGILKFALKKKNYEDLRCTNVICPQYLVIMCVPRETSKWVDHGADFMALRNCCYWLSIRGAPHSDNDSTVTVNVPISQRLNTAELIRLVALASDGKSA